MITARAVDKHVEQLFEVLRRLHDALTRAGIPYRLVGGLGVFFQVSGRNPLAARLTQDVDVAVDRKDLQRIATAVKEFGFRYRQRELTSWSTLRSRKRVARFISFSSVKRSALSTWSPFLTFPSRPSPKKEFCSLRYPIW